MSSSSWRYGKRSKHRAKVSQDPEDYYRIDANKTAAENAKDIYEALCCRDTRDTKRLFLLNGLATLCQEQQQQHELSSLHSIGFSTEELLYCLSAALVHTSTQVRAAALRSIRYALATPRDLKIFNCMQLQHLLCRSIDVLLRNDDERIQALKLIRKMLALSPEDISPVIVRCLVSLADTGMEDSDNMLRACLATLCEFAVLNPTLLIVCGGVTAITRNVLECPNPRIGESLCGVLLYLLDWPQTRNICGVRLDCLAAPYCDFTYRLGIMDKNKDARELRYYSCRLALLSVLRSWIGTIEFCDPSKPSGLKAIVDALYLNQSEVRKAILDLLYELLGLSQPVWTDDYAIAMQSLDPSECQDAWLLSNGFVAMEGRSILPSLAARAPNICEQHLSLLLYCFLETGLLNALTEVIVSADSFLSVRATVLIGKILHLMHTHLPADICSTNTALPTLLTHATQDNQQANAAISALQNYQKMLRNRPASCSLFLDSILQGGALVHSRLFRRDIGALDGNTSLSSGTTAAPTFIGTLERQRLESVSSSDESQSQASSSRRSSFRLKRRFLPFLENLRVNRLIKDSNVLTHTDLAAWDWEVVSAILRSNVIRKLDDTTGKFLKKLVEYFKPSSNCFSHQDLQHGPTVPPFITAGLDLIDFLLSNNELESMRLITDYFSDISQQLLAVSTSNRAHDCLFSPQHMSNTMCQQYFLFIGRMCRTNKGISILNNTAVFEHLINLVSTTDHVCYVKLIVSGLDYSLESITRKVLEKSLTMSKTRSGRLYATQFLLVLLRARIPNFEVWGIPLIIQQLKDADRSVVLAALDVLEEACHEKYYLEEIVSLWPNLKSVGDYGRLVMARYYSLSRGLNHSRARIKDEIEYWKQGYNKRYVLLVEADTHANMTLHVRNEDGYYSRRNCNSRPVIIPANIPAHLYGQMVQTAQGMTALRKHADLPYLIEVLTRGKCADYAECLELKAAIWALGHASTHANGIEYFLESGARIYEKLLLLATKCEVYSVRANCFNVLGLIAGNSAGANVLYKLNWLSVRHDRNTYWPVHQAEDWLSSNFTPIRHHYEDMPPYNYAGMEDQIDGSFYAGSYWNLLLKDAETPATTTATTATLDVHTDIESTTKTGAKSRTLPEGSYMRYGKHQRSLSESKTTDVISLINAPNAASAYYQQQRIRYNSCTDSNTSGVSSCESVTARGAPQVGGEFLQFPLSPIPSLSNLVELQQPSDNLLRRTSLLGTSYLQNALSAVDAKGYAQLRSLRRHCRPVLSESSADLYDILNRSELVTYASFRPRKSSFGEMQRHLKVRSLDRQTTLRMQLSAEEVSPVPLPNLYAATNKLLLPPPLTSQNDAKGPCYAGICLPKNLLDLFPKRNVNRTYVSSELPEQDLMDINMLTANQQFLNDSLNNEAGDESSVISSLSDVSSVSKRSKWLGAKHGRNSCLQCARLRRSSRQAQRLENEAMYDLHMSVLASTSAAAQNLFALSKKTGSKITQQQQQQQPNAAANIQLSDISFNSPESIISEESLPDRLTVNILHNVQRLANPVSAKQSKMALLELKQKHPAAFQDICLYSEVCKTLGRSTYRMSARRFLQELFLDLNFDSFNVEPLDILSKKEKEFATAAAKTEEKQQLHQQQQQQHIELSSAPKATNATATIGATTAVAVAVAGTSTAKSYMIYQPLASVYESSCENLLEQSPRLQQNCKRANATTAATTATATTVATTAVNVKGKNVLTTAASFKNELHITSDDDDDEDLDEVVGYLQRSAAAFNQKLTQLSTVNTPPTSSSNCSSDPATNSSSNRSSVCTISQHPASLHVTKSCNASSTTSPTPTTTALTAIENQNKIYTRGRFYTLELDLSCSKNKFPISERRRQSNQSNSAQQQQQQQQQQQPTSPYSSSTWSLLQQSAIVNNSSINKLNEKRALLHQRANSVDEQKSSIFPITKSLAASLANPIGSLYCEKRLQTAKSEAMLAATITTTATTSAANRMPNLMPTNAITLHNATLASSSTAGSSSSSSSKQPG